MGPNNQVKIVKVSGNIKLETGREYSLLKLSSIIPSRCQDPTHLGVRRDTFAFFRDLNGEVEDGWKSKGTKRRYYKIQEGATGFKIDQEVAPNGVSLVPLITWLG